MVAADESSSLGLCIVAADGSPSGWLWMVDARGFRGAWLGIAQRLAELIRGSRGSQWR